MGVIYGCENPHICILYVCEESLLKRIAEKRYMWYKKTDTT